MIGRTQRRVTCAGHSAGTREQPSHYLHTWQRGFTFIPHGAAGAPASRGTPFCLGALGNCLWPLDSDSFAARFFYYVHPKHRTHCFAQAAGKRLVILQAVLSPSLTIPNKSPPLSLSLRFSLQSDWRRPPNPRRMLIT